MRKMMLLAAMVAMAALMLAAAPAMAQDLNGEDGRDDGFCDFFDCDDDFCDFFDCNDDFCDFFDCNNTNNNVVPAITQDFDQEAESGDVNQSFDVSNTGDNSNQTVGIQGVANTGNAQNQIGVVDAGDFADFDNNNDDFCDFFDCDEDDFCDDFRGDDFCEDLEDFCDDFDGNGICDFFDDDDDDFRRFDDDFFFFGDDNDNGDIEFEEGGSTIELSPTNTVSSDQQVNQAASASGS
jgi:hypothetical protein